jgi:hypothetical protein
VAQFLLHLVHLPDFVIVLVRHLAGHPQDERLVRPVPAHPAGDRERVVQCGSAA